MKKEEKTQEKLTLKEKLKDKKEKAKIQLIIYGVFFIGVFIFAKVMGRYTSNTENNNPVFESFISSVTDNYEYDMQIIINENVYEYYGKVLGNNSTINLKDKDKIISYYQMNQKYYILEDDNYILTDVEEIYPYISIRYLNINTIKQYINISIKENNTYKVKLSDIILNNKSEEYLTINIEEGDKNIIIDYTPLFKLNDENIEKVVVNITYSNIDNIISLEE